MTVRDFIIQTWHLYYDGFRSMTVGKKLWIIILIKIILFFLIIRPLFFPNLLDSLYDREQDKSEHVGDELIRKRGQ
jgi:hypothetical protein